MSRFVVFDCDGTLVDGQEAICETMELAFANAGLVAPERNKVRRIVGLSLPYALRELAPEASDDQRHAVVEAYKLGYRDLRLSGALREPLFEGIAALIDELDAEGRLLGVATGKSDRGLHACLDTHGIKHRFVSLQTADRHPSKPHPAMLEAALDDAGVSPADAVMIGDTSFDMEMAVAAGVRAIGVSWGYHEPQELFDTGASAVAETAQHLGDLKARFLTIQAVRLSGVALAVLGALVLGQILPLPEFVGYIFLALGAVDVFILPIFLAKRWRSVE